MLNVENLSFSYSKNLFLHDISFNINQGEFSALIGKNGAGKTTIFRCILRMISTYTGDIYIDDYNIKDMSTKDLSKKIAYISQNSSTAYNYSVKDYILMGTNNQYDIFSSPDVVQYDMLDRVLKRIGIEYLVNKSFNRISGGEQQLVMIARALIQNTNYIIMDEPTSALDFFNQESIMCMINDLVEEENIGILISLHDPNLVIRHCDKVIALANGTKIIDGVVKDVFNEDLIKKIYGVDCKIYKTENGSFIQGVL